MPIPSHGIPKHAMNEQPNRPSARRRIISLAPFALAAGLIVGHVVEAMGRTAGGDPMTAVAAFIFVAAALAGTVCGLAGLSAPHDSKRARARIPGLLVVTGAGIVVALLPGLV